MPRGKRTLPTLLCPNLDWDGCCQHEWKMRKKYKEHVAKCNLARRRDDIRVTEEGSLRPIVQQILERLAQLEDQNAKLRNEVHSLREAAQCPTIRGPYEVRGEGETPEHGFGQWSCDFFVENLKKTDDFYRASVGHSVLKRSIKEFISAVFWVSNGNCHVVRVRPKTLMNRDGTPAFIDLNFKTRRRQVTLEAAVKRIFEKPFLPSSEEVEEELGEKVPDPITQGLKYYAHYMGMRPSKKERSFGSWEAKVELILAIANFTAPKREVKKSKAERADEAYNFELEETGRWWVQPKTWTMERIVETYDGFLAHSEAYKADLRSYFKERPDRRQEYHEAGGYLA